jgi:restriction endonuclease S subunit
VLVLILREIKDFATFIPGINPTRAEKQFGKQLINYYDQPSFEADYNHVDDIGENELKFSSLNNAALNAGDLIISNGSRLAAMVGKNNAGKVLALNFTKIDLDSDHLDQRYFLFLFNDFKEVQRQKERGSQRSGLVQRIPLRTLGEILIPVIPLAEQKKIGAIYTERLKLQNNLNKYSALIERFTSAIIAENLKGAMPT